MGLQVISVSHPASPTLLGRYADGTFSPWVAALVDGRLYLGDDAVGRLAVLDVAYPATLVSTGRRGTTSVAHDVVVGGDRAHVAVYAAGLNVIDVSNPASPARIGHCPFGGAAIGVATAGNHAPSTVVQLTATSEPGYRVKAWMGTSNDASMSLTNSVTMNADKAATVGFELCTGPVGDDDQDGVTNCLDLCPTSIAGITVDVDGCPPAISGDFDRDGDVDREDFGRLRICRAGSLPPQADPTCRDADLNTSNAVDRTDVDQFINCFSGSLVPGRQNCAW